MGCQKTNFCNPHGLHDPKHVSTAYDLALITQEALKNQTFRTIVSQKSFLRPKTNKQAATTLLQTNRLLRPGKLFYPKAKCLLYWHPVGLPIVKGQTVGELQLADAQGKVLKHAPLIASEDVPIAWPYRWPLFYWIAGGLAGLLIAIAFFRKRR